MSDQRKETREEKAEGKPKMAGKKQPEKGHKEQHLKHLQEKDLKEKNLQKQLTQEELHRVEESSVGQETSITTTENPTTEEEPEMSINQESSETSLILGKKGQSLPPGKPISLQVGSFERVLDLLKTSECEIVGRQSPKITLAKLIENCDPDGVQEQEMGQLWRDSLGPPRTNLTGNMYRMFRKNIRPTLLVVVEQKQFHCHAIVLQILSPFFQRPQLAQSHVFHLPSSMVTARSFVAIYRWALEGCHHLSGNHLMQILRAARFFGCQEIVTNCWQIIEMGTQDPERALSLYHRGKILDLHIEESLLCRLASLFLQFVASDEFRRMEFGYLKQLLEVRNLAVNSEMEVFMSALLWLDYEWPQRKPHVMELMETIHFDQMPFLFLLTFERRTDGPPVLRLLAESKEMQERNRKIVKSMRNSPRKYQGRCGRSTCRNWIFDRRAPHHHGSRCRKVLFLDYDSFVLYLKNLQAIGLKHWRSLRSITDPQIRCCR